MNNLLRQLPFVEALKATPARDLYHKLRHVPLEVRGIARQLADRAAVKGDPGLSRLHAELADILERQRAEWPHYAFGFRYFYQGYTRVHISGIRPTELRFQHYDVAAHLRPTDRVLDLGCNSGFMAIEASYHAAHVDGVEWNPYMVEAGQAVARYLQRDNVHLQAGDLNAFEASAPYDCVMAYACYHTDDHGNREGIDAHFDKLHALLRPGGTLLFESHYVDIHNPDFHAFMERLTPRFERLQRTFVSNGPDRGGDRYYYVLKRGDDHAGA